MRRIIALLLILAFSLSMVGCNNNTSNTEQHPVTNQPIVINGVEIQDSFISLEFKPIEVKPIDVNEITVDKILVNCITVKEIETIEIDPVTINDEFVYVAYQNFVSIYGDDFSLKDFLVDLGIGAGCVLVYVTLSVAGGPVGTFFGAILTSQFTTSAVVIGTAIDAAVSAYQAYQEGGDLSYILGHMLNGVADGIKWSAILAPLTGVVDGIKAIKAVKALKKVPGLEDITDKEARKIFEVLADIINKADGSLDNLSDDAFKNLAKNLPKDMTEELTEQVLKNIITNKQLIVDIIKKFNPFNVSKKVVKALQDNFLKQTGLSDDAAKELIKLLKKGTIKSLEEISDEFARDFIEKNLFEFVQYFGSSLSKDFIDNYIKKTLGDDAFDLMKKFITSDDLYLELVKKIGRESADEVVSDTNTLIMLQLRYGSKNVNKLVNVHTLYEQMLKSNNIPENQVSEALSDIIKGKIKNISDIEKINKQLAKNLINSREVVAKSIKNLGNGKSLSGLLDDIAQKGMEVMDIKPEIAADIINNSLTKTDIVSRYGDDVYKKLFSTNNYDLTINCLEIQNKVNKSLTKELTTDALKSKGLADDIVENILSGKGITEWGIADEQIMSLSNMVADYYRMTDINIYRNYINEIAEKRGEYIADFLEKYKKSGNKITKIEYAGDIMEPHINSNPAYIKSKYGNIYMSKKGFPIFDEYAIARIELPDLEGLDDDILRANVIHHGTQTSIPGYTWHHLEDGKTLILIPTDLHEAYRHTGGAALIREGL